MADEVVVVPTLDARQNERLARVLGGSDERKYARIVASRWDFPLIEHERRPDSFDMGQLHDAPLSVRPFGFSYNSDLDRDHIRIAQDIGAEAFFTGEAGDAVFENGGSPRRAADYVYLHGFGSKFWKFMMDSARVGDSSIWTVLSIAIKEGLFRRKEAKNFYKYYRERLVSKEVIENQNFDDLESPWINSLIEVPPAKRTQIDSVLFFSFLSHMFGRSKTHAAFVHPYFSQPVIETSWRIPSYILIDGGRSRGLSLKAFADLLPDEIRRRRTKGHGDPFLQRIVKRNLPFVREFLLDGMAVKEGLLDGPGLDAFLVEDQPFKEIMASEILDYLDKEAWLRSWSNVMSHRAAA